jgi:hypothetical protein
MRILVVALTVGLAAMWTVAPSTHAAIGAGCGESGPSRSDAAPFARVRPAALAINARVRLESFAADQTAGATVRLDAVGGGTTLAETPAGQYTCVAPASATRRITVPLTRAGIAKLRAQASVTVHGTLALVNGNGVTRSVSFTTTIVSARVLPASAPGPCRYQVASQATVLRGATLGIAVRACRVRTLRVGLVALDGAHRGNIALRHTFTPDRPGVVPTSITIGAVQAGRYRLVLLGGRQRLARARTTLTVRVSLARED